MEHQEVPRKLGPLVLDTIEAQEEQEQRYKVQTTRLGPLVTGEEPAPQIAEVRAPIPASAPATEPAGPETADESEAALLAAEAEAKLRAEAEEQAAAEKPRDPYTEEQLRALNYIGVQRLAKIAGLPYIGVKGDDLIASLIGK